MYARNIALPSFYDVSIEFWNRFSSVGFFVHVFTKMSNAHDQLILYLYICLYIYVRGTVMVVIVWYLDLQLPLQAVPITAKVVSSNPVHGEVYSITHYVIDKVCR